MLVFNSIAILVRKINVASERVGEWASGHTSMYIVVFVRASVWVAVSVKIFSHQQLHPPAQFSI